MSQGSVSALDPMHSSSALPQLPSSGTIALVEDPTSNATVCLAPALPVGTNSSHKQNLPPGTNILPGAFTMSPQHETTVGCSIQVSCSSMVLFFLPTDVPSLCLGRKSLVCDCAQQIYTKLIQTPQPATLRWCSSACVSPASTASTSCKESEGNWPPKTCLSSCIKNVSNPPVCVVHSILLFPCVSHVPSGTYSWPSALWKIWILQQMNLTESGTCLTQKPRRHVAPVLSCPLHSPRHKFGTRRARRPNLGQLPVRNIIKISFFSPNFFLFCVVLTISFFTFLFLNDFRPSMTTRNT